MEELPWSIKKMDQVLASLSLSTTLSTDTTGERRVATTEPFRMDLLPDDLVQHILSYLTDANDVALASCVSKKWKDFLSIKHRLHFPLGNILDKLDSTVSTDEIVRKMVSSMVQLEELLVYWPFTTSSLASWLAATGNSLRKLDVLVDNFNEHDTVGKLDCIQYASNLESPKLCYVLIDKSPKWDIFHNLRNLEIYQVYVTEPSLSDALRACLNLTYLSIAFGGEAKLSLSIDMQHLEKCMLDFYESSGNSVSLACPKLTTLTIRGCSWIRVRETQCLRHLHITNASGVTMLDFGKLAALKCLHINGIIMCWDVISNMLQLASEVKHLFLSIVFAGDLEKPHLSSEIDFVEFFNSHPKLQRFDMHAAMFHALCQKNSLKNADSRFSIPCLEEVSVKVGGSLHDKQPMSTLESLLKYAPNLKKITIKVIPMKNLIKEVYKFADMNSKIVCVESW